MNDSSHAALDAFEAATLLAHLREEQDPTSHTPPSREPHTRETVRITKDGRVLDVVSTLTVLRDDLDRPIGIAATEYDITKHRALEREVLQIAVREQRRIGQDLHDEIGQELTGLGLLAEALAESLNVQSHEEGSLAGKLSRGIRRTLNSVRDLSRGLIPVEIEVFFRTIDGRIRFEICDDGIGIAKLLSTSGSGLKIMRYRASMFNATLDVHRRPAGGTTVLNREIHNVPRITDD